jgi:hypothetical protein
MLQRAAAISPRLRQACTRTVRAVCLLAPSDSRNGISTSRAQERLIGSLVLAGAPASRSTASQIAVAHPE